MAASRITLDSSMSCKDNPERDAKGIFIESVDLDIVLRNVPEAEFYERISRNMHN